MKKVVHIVPHSHWDREWYFTLEDSQVLLGENLSRLIDFLEKNPHFPAYTFDGQVSIIDDFMGTYPEYADRLKTLIKEKRILIGPWYTQCDSLLVNIESLIRNLHYGIKRAKNYGYSMNVGYLPDIFGQNSYLPSIFQNFGIDTAIFQRGILNKDLSNGLNLTWESPDGVSIWTNNIFLGYGPGKFLDADSNYVQNTLVPMLDKLASFNTNQQNLLLPSGGDQVFVRKHFPETIELINEQLSNYKLVMSTYEQFAEASKKEATPQTTISGELRETQKSRIHRTIGSQRYDIKYFNQLWEHKMLNILEPLNAFTVSNGFSPMPQKWIDDLWTNAFEVHSHDSIGGCNSDDTNKNIIERLHRMHRITDDWINIIQKRFASSVSDKNNSILVWNLDIHTYQGFVECDIFRNNDFVLFDGKEKLPMQILSKEYISGGKKIVVTAEKEMEVEIEGYYHYKVLVKTQIPAMSYKSLVIVDAPNQEISSYEERVTLTIANDYYEFSVNADNLVLTNKQSGKSYTNPMRFEFSHDFGDSYDYSPSKQDPQFFTKITDISVKIGALSEVMNFTHVLTVPSSMSDSTPLKLEIKTAIELRKNQKVMSIHHTLNNAAKDWRLRVLWSVLHEEITHSAGMQGFAYHSRSLENPNLETWKDQKFVEAPVGIYNFDSTMSVFSANERLDCFAMGLKEYEIVDQDLALTLFRSVGLLGRDDLEWRPGRASGINNKVVYTPNAWLLQEMDFSYALMIGEKISDHEALHYQNQFLSKVTSYQLQSLNSFLYRLDRFELPIDDVHVRYNNLISIDSKELFCSSLRYEKNHIVFRVFNPSQNIVRSEIKINASHKAVYMTDLLEENKKNSKHISVPPRSYATILVEI